MTAPQAPEQAPDGRAEAPGAGCPRCGAPLRPDQDWCLNCGAAVTTHVAGAPGWRTPVAIVGTVLALAAAALVFAFLEISNDAEQEVASAPTPTATAEPAPTVTPDATPGATPDGDTGGTGLPGDGTASDPADPDAPTTGDPATGDPGTDDPATGDPATPGAIESWPAGESGYTVILASETSRADAERKAEQFRSSGEPIGILRSDDFSSLRPGYDVVFSGQYDSLEAAREAAERLRGTAPDAYARRIEPK